MKPWFFVALGGLIASAPFATSQNRPQQQAPSPKGTVQGLVVRAGTGQPLKGVRISFQRSAQQPQQALLFEGAPAALNTVTAAVTDAAGRFVVTGVEAGQYRVFAEREGFIRQEFGQRRATGSGTLVNVAAGQELTLSFSLPVAGVISGRVFNEENEPVSRLTVQAYTYRYVDGKRSLAPVGSGQTNDLGEYRIFWLPPGDYFVSVLATNATAGQESRADLSARQATGTDLRNAVVSIAGPAGEAAGQVMRLFDCLTGGAALPKSITQGRWIPKAPRPSR
jgi:hypothetical protein